MSRHFTRSPDLVERTIRGEHLLVPVARSEATLGSLFTLNETARFVWDRAGAGQAEDGIAAALAREFGVSPAQAAADTRRVLDELLSIGALRLKGGP
ncbi:MAG TPA: PqqD family protein [Kiritimatiellia bacterium]|nr:PqqD family protein [Kiritimatiellia bacterium]HRZ13371.1 PqqD family protein [Kiritimatiellia bacterium]HSA18989.1 PqqD family protein [Kiritimatiellia bacterium]